MKRLIAWFAANRVSANLFLLTVFGGGILSILFGLRFELFPEVTPRLITVRVPYPGASPEEVERAVCIRIEEAIQEIEGIRTLTSYASEGVGLVLVELEHHVSIPEALDEVRSRVEGIETFPEETERPQVRDVPLELQTLTLAVAGRVDEISLKRAAERVRDELQEIPGVTLVRLAGARAWEISVEVSEAALRRYGLTFEEAARALREGSIDLPGGTIKTPTGEIQLRTKEQAYRGREFAAIPLRFRPDGSRVLLGDVARIRDGFAEEELQSRFDGEPAVLVQVFRTGEQSALELADKVRGYVERARARLPEGIRVTVWQDWSRVLRDRLELLGRNARLGLALVFVALALFLRPRVAFWVTVGIPVAFLGALWLMPGLGQSINLLTLFGFVLVLGIVVDDAIVVSENIYRRRTEGLPPLDAAVEGARQVLLPVSLAVLTNILAFVPMLTLPGANGDFARAIATVVILCFSFSLLESFVALPAHLSKLSAAPPPAGWRGALPRAQDRVAKGFDAFVDRVYRPALRAAVRHRWLTLAAGVAALLTVGGAVAGGRVKFDFFPPVDADNVVASLELPQDAPAAETARAVERLERAAREVVAELERELGRPIGRHVLATLGARPTRQAQDPDFGANAAAFAGSHLGEVNLELVPSEARALAAEEVVRRWRERAGPIAGARELSFSYSATRGGAAISLELRSPDLETLPEAARRLRERLESFPGVFGAADSWRAGRPELRVSPNPSARALGITAAEMARQVRQAFYGEEVQRIQRGRDDVRVMLRYPEEERRSVGYLERMRVRGPDGAAPPLKEAATLEWGSGPATIQRRDRRRAVVVTADVVRGVANANEVVAALEADFLPGLKRDYPGLDVAYAGEQREQREMVQALLSGMALALLLIYALLAVLFRSYVQPALVMAVIPFAVAGAVAAHGLLGMPLTMLSLIGVMALIGVVVNDSVVMIAFTNERRALGKDPAEAVLEAGPVRFRPILLTSLTTFAGLAPMLFERSLQAQFLIPMAVSLAYGVLVSTFVTLFLVPSAYLAVTGAGRPSGSRAS